MDVNRLLDITRGYECLSCGKCTGTCPVALTNPSFSPRTLIERALLDFRGKVLEQQDYWQCLTCGLCTEKCNRGVDFTTLVKELRRVAFDARKRPHYAHGEILQTIMRMSLDAKESGPPAVDSDYYFFRGCARYVEWLTEGETGLGAIESSVLAILARLGITPAVPERDVCCGHDLLWTGDRKSCQTLALENIERILLTDAKYVVTACPECLHTFRVEYPKLVGEIPFKVMHWTEVVKEREGTLAFAPLEEDAGKVTYHDSCRMGRFLGLYDGPRSLIGLAGGAPPAEMRSTRSRALCCGTSQWIECGAAARERQMNLLREAAETGADTLVTSCPKCLTHLTCAAAAPSAEALRGLRVVDLATYVARRLAPAPEPEKVREVPPGRIAVDAPPVSGDAVVAEPAAEGKPPAEAGELTAPAPARKKGAKKKAPAEARTRADAAPASREAPGSVGRKEAPGGGEPPEATGESLLLDYL